MGLKTATGKTQSAVIFKVFPPPQKDNFGSEQRKRKQGGKIQFMKLNSQTLAKCSSGPKGTLLRKAETYPDHVMHSVDITVTHIDANGTESETVFLSSPMDDDWWFQVCDSRRKVAAG